MWQAIEQQEFSSFLDIVGNSSEAGGGFQGAAAVGLDVPACLGVAFGLAIRAFAGVGLCRINPGGVDDIDLPFGHDNVFFLKLTVNFAQLKVGKICEITDHETRSEPVPHH